MILIITADKNKATDFKRNFKTTFRPWYKNERVIINLLFLSNKYMKTEEPNRHNNGFLNLVFVFKRVQSLAVYIR